jgi:hypothetical protein
MAHAGPIEPISERWGYGGTITDNQRFEDSGGRPVAGPVDQRRQCPPDAVELLRQIVR